MTEVTGALAGSPAARKLPVGRRRIFHVPKGTAYAIENSSVGVRWAIRLFFKWIDLDLHVTKAPKDHKFGTPVFCHWQEIRKEHYIIPEWFAKKYGPNPRIENVYYEDLRKLVSKPLKYRRRSHRVHYYSVVEMLTLIKKLSPKLGVSVEAKFDKVFNDPAFWVYFGQLVRKVGFPQERLQYMTLQDHGTPYDCLKAIKTAGLGPTILLSRRPIPRARLHDFDYVRGPMKIV